MKKHSFINKKIIVVMAITALIVVFFTFDMQQYLTLETVKNSQVQFHQFYLENIFITIVIYMLIYIVVIATSIPGALVMTLCGGALFGMVAGSVIVSFASTIGATLAFLISRFLLRDYVQNRFRDKLQVMNEGTRREGEYYLFTLRLIPLFPFFLINLVMGLTPIKTLKFSLVSLVGMLPGTVVYVFAGTQLARIDSLQGILSQGLILAFIILGLFPLVTKKGVAMAKSRRLTKKY